MWNIALEGVSEGQQEELGAQTTIFRIIALQVFDFNQFYIKSKSIL